MGEEIVNLMVEGGKATAGAALGMKLGPMGINLGKIVQDINEQTKGFAGIQVPVKITVNPKTKEYKIAVGTPPTAQLIKKKIKLEKGSGKAGTEIVGNISLDDLIDISKSKTKGSISNSVKTMLLQVVGTCISIGLTIDGKKPAEITAEIKSGKHDDKL